MDNKFLEKYKDIHKNQSSILFGSGPSIKNFHEKKNVIKVGLNEMIYLDLDLDYWFMGDTTPRYPGRFLKHFNDYNEYKPNIQKFIRNQTWSEMGKMPSDMKHAEYYTCDLGGMPDKCMFRTEITEGNTIGVSSISFEALEFLLYTGVSTIYLVGHDCNYDQGTFRTKYDKSKKSIEGYMIKYWRFCEEWINENYPDVTIYSINPIGLKDIFETAEVSDIIENN